MTDCTGCGHDLGNDRFCTQCGLPAGRPEPAMSASTTRTAAPRTPPPAPPKRAARFPLYADRPAGQHTGPTEPPPDPRLSETSVAEIGVTERIARTVASGDPTWLMSFGVLVGVLAGVFILGCILVLI